MAVVRFQIDSVVGVGGSVRCRRDSRPQRRDVTICDPRADQWTSERLVHNDGYSVRGSGASALLIARGGDGNIEQASQARAYRHPQPDRPRHRATSPAPTSGARIEVREGGGRQSFGLEAARHRIVRPIMHPFRTNSNLDEATHRVEWPLVASVFQQPVDPHVPTATRLFGDAQRRPASREDVQLVEGHWVPFNNSRLAAASGLHSVHATTFAKIVV